MVMDAFERLRPVGRLERYSTARHDLRFYLNAAVTASYTLPDRCSPPLPLKHYIYEACRTVVGLHPILSAIPVDEHTPHPQFVRLPEINLDRCVSFHERRPVVLEPDPSVDATAASTSLGWDARGDTGTGTGTDTDTDTDLDELLTTQHNMAFAPPHPFWRLCVLTDAARPHCFTAAFVFHHAIGDGTSGMAFHRAFHQALSQAVSVSPVSDQTGTGTGTGTGPATATAIIPSPSTALLPSVEALHAMPISIIHLVTILFKEKVWSRRDPGLWTGSKISVPLDNRVRHIAFAPSTTRGFIDACRTHGTTVTAALQTLVAGVLFSHLPAHTFTALKCAGAISMRRWLPGIIDDNSMGVFVQDLSEDYSRADFQTGRLPWAEAKRSRDTITHVLSLEGRNAGPNLLRYVNDYQQELFLSKVGKERQSSFEVSNLGAFRRTTQSKTLESSRSQSGSGSGTDVEIGRMVFTQSANVAGSAFEVSVVSGEDGCLALGFSWQKGVVEAGLMDEVINGVQEEVIDVAVNGVEEEVIRVGGSTGPDPEP
ncbi:hypothetical protein A1O3_01167 [Capronia epimyces CBS 606.96]|uniref:Alcohol acetyltransferase n=1 Tax=Capronia epimyces CBS 606.96 TaxID=1182542 RepID=W9YSH2_9EURO|nr:uncharacterized protein A1O3_01167 [Capronia epimyces CBS 606.96]EXJ92615.1 hypothetical protein A1O3_01167 [Capronia epimyces CBS 606.96]